LFPENTVSEWAEIAYPVINPLVEKYDEGEYSQPRNGPIDLICASGLITMAGSGGR
jgi:hypothetical protein